MVDASINVDPVIDLYAANTPNSKNPPNTEPGINRLRNGLIKRIIAFAAIIPVIKIVSAIIFSIGGIYLGRKLKSKGYAIGICAILFYLFIILCLSLTNFNFSKIADYYAYQATPEEQRIFEKLALVLLDKDKLIENGYADLLKEYVNEEK